MFLALNARLVLPDDRLLLLMMQAMAGREYSRCQADSRQIADDDPMPQRCALPR